MILDTHVAIWIDEDLEISSEAKREIEAAVQQGTLGLSAISAWEIAMLIRTGRLRVPTTSEQFIGSIFDLPGVREIAVSLDIARIAGEFSDELHGDPADRIIAATAAHLDVPLVTRDRRILEFSKKHGGFACIAA